MSQQGTDEWKAERIGKVTASKLIDVVDRTKSGGFTAKRAAYASQLAIERITRQPYTFNQSAAMQFGTATEPEARNEYRATVFEEVTEVGFIDHPSIPNAGASPDSLVGDDGLVEIKCPETHTHLNYLLEDVIPEKYSHQMFWQMACTGRKWCDFVSYDPRAPEGLRLFVKRLERDDIYISTAEESVKRFLKEVDELEQKLRNKLSEKQK